MDTHITRLVAFAQEKQLIQPEDTIYTTNQLLGLLQLTDFSPVEVAVPELENPASLLTPLIDYAVAEGIIEDTITERDLFDTKLMDVFMPRPSQVIAEFNSHYAIQPQKATEYFYTLSKASNYIRTDRTNQNIVWQTSTPYGMLDMTINLSKPEKDPRDIAKEKHVKSTNYPKCLLCVENEGFHGTIKHPARNNHRILPVSLTGESWYLQYSPYVYYNEHCIVLKGAHEPMKIQKATFARLLAFVEKFPHYFVGSNADLPIVGGSILAHDHFQGGRHTFAMETAESYPQQQFSAYPEVSFAQVKWPMSVVRLQSHNQEQLVAAAEHVFRTWQTYSDGEVEILAFSGETPHNTVTPIARMRDGKYELDLVLRNNRTDAQHPLGIFHPHDDVHHIKKENIGLIEVMGLAVLPARLATELEQLVQSFQAGELDLATNPDLAKHEAWFQALQAKYPQLPANEVSAMFQAEVGLKFMRVLEDAGVFKQDEQGDTAFKRFLATIR